MKRRKSRPRKTNEKSTKFESKLEVAFLEEWKLRYPEKPIVTQYHFHSERAWRFDFAFPDQKVAVELQGYGQGHASYDSMHKDYVRHNMASLLGWRVLYFMGRDVQPSKIGNTIRFVHDLVYNIPKSPPVPNNHLPPALRDAINARNRLKGGTE